MWLDLEKEFPFVVHLVCAPEFAYLFCDFPIHCSKTIFAITLIYYSSHPRIAIMDDSATNPIQPTYYGLVETEQDANLLLDACFMGALHPVH